MNSYKLWLDGEEEFKHTELAETPGKAKYQFYKYLQDGYLCPSPEKGE
ncbi:hypothetical protein [Bacillus cereus]|nr:hypothetical protein [Bacillus cereus]